MLQIEGLYDQSEPKTKDYLGGLGGSGIGDEAQQNARVEGLVITQITAGVRNPNRVNIFINGRYTFSLDINQVIDLQVKVGRVLSEAELQELRAASEFGKLYQRALEWVLMRPRSIRETRDYLKNRQLKRIQTNRKRANEELKPLPEIQTTTLELVLQRLVERGYVDDEKFAEFYVENRFTKKGVSTKRLRSELSKKGISQSIIERVLNESVRTDQDELMKMLRKKRKRYDDQKLIAYLVRQGFNYADAIEAVENYNDNEVSDL